jgi:hypothetical protein
MREKRLWMFLQVNPQRDSRRIPQSFLYSLQRKLSLLRGAQKGGKSGGGASFVLKEEREVLNFFKAP